eukprot:8357217-Lingulodinium_polyedra.AAC.1
MGAICHGSRSQTKGRTPRGWCSAGSAATGAGAAAGTSAICATAPASGERSPSSLDSALGSDGCN